MSMHLRNLVWRRSCSLRNVRLGCVTAEHTCKWSKWVTQALGVVQRCRGRWFFLYWNKSNLKEAKVSSLYGQSRTTLWSQPVSRLKSYETVTLTGVHAVDGTQNWKPMLTDWLYQSSTYQYSGWRHGRTLVLYKISSFGKLPQSSLWLYKYRIEPVRDLIPFLLLRFGFVPFRFWTHFLLSEKIS